jgi:Reverse transcriptase (RNA-dependent DNA polymerase)
MLNVKRHSGGAFERHKTRLVLLGNLQRPHIEFYDTYSPVADLAVVRIMFVIACDRKWLIHQLDVKCAFINSRIGKYIYMRMPDGCGTAGGLFCKLKRRIFRLRQAPRAWSKRLTNDLRLAGYNPLINAESEFRSIEQGVVVYLIIFVEDILVLTESMKARLRVKKQLSKMYTVQDIGEAEYLLGVKIERRSSTVKLMQTSYVKSILDRFGILEFKPAQMPMSNPVSLMIKQPHIEDEVSQMKEVPFREAIGSVFYLAV